MQLAEEMADGRIAEVLVPTEDLIEIKKVKKLLLKDLYIQLMHLLKLILILVYGIEFNQCQKLEDLLVNQKTNCII